MQDGITELLFESAELLGELRIDIGRRWDFTLLALEFIHGFVPRGELAILREAAVQ
jgi:hypothetical protein